MIFSIEETQMSITYTHIKMDGVVKKLTNLINKNGIKVVTISEPNHRSYTSHTFNFMLMKSLLKNTQINTFSTEKLGVFDAMMIDWYLQKGKSSRNQGWFPEDSFQFKGLGTKRWLSYFKKLRNSKRSSNRLEFNLVGTEFNPYNPYQYEKEALSSLFSQKFIDSLFDPLEGGGNIQVETENDKLARDSFECMEDFYKNRESFWKLNVERVLEKYDNLFIVGFHLSKGDPIGKMIKKMYPDTSLFLGSCALNITTQILITSDKFSQPDAFNQALESGKYDQKLEKIDKWAPPTLFEKSRNSTRTGWSLTKVVDSNKSQKIRGIGCFIAMTRREYDKEKKVSDIHLPLRYFDYIVYMRDSQYREDMYL